MRIVFGPFAGLEGVVESASKSRVTVRVSLGDKSILIELSHDMIEGFARR